LILSSSEKIKHRPTLRGLFEAHQTRADALHIVLRTPQRPRR
jgi:hypothetical protein